MRPDQAETGVCHCLTLRAILANPLFVVIFYAASSSHTAVISYYYIIINLKVIKIANSGILVTGFSKIIAGSCNFQAIAFI